MIPIPYRRRLLFADGAASLYPDELPRDLFLGQTVDTSRHLLLHEADRAAHVYICGVTGSGKSRFLENLLVQDVISGRPLCLLDPTGGLYRKMLEVVACCIEIAERQGHDPEQLLERYRFLDLDAAVNPLRVNPLEAQGDETTEEQVDDFLKVAERLFGSIDEMRRIRNTLRNTLWVLSELNRLPSAQRPPLDGFTYPLNLRYVAEFLSETDEARTRLVEAIPDTELNSYVKTYWMRFFARYTPAQQQERLESTWNILQYFLGDSLVARFFDTQESTLHVPELLHRRQSLFCSLPLGKNLKGCQLVGTYLATKFQRAAYRRPRDERHPYYLYIDEFHEFADVEFAKAAATLRQYNLRMVNAHQSQSQPPFHTPEGRSILETIKANAQVKVLFRLSREDAETMTKELFELTQQRPNFRYTEVAHSEGDTETKTRTASFQQSQISGLNWSRASSVAIAESETYGVAKTEGVTVGETLTEGFGESITETISETITRSQSETLTEMRSRAHGISVLIGDNWSHMVNHNTGFTFTKGRNESLAVQRGLSSTRTGTQQSGLTDTTGRDYKISDSRGNSFVRTRNQVAHHSRDSGPLSRETAGQSHGSGTSMSAMQQQSRSEGKSYSKAIQSLRGIASAIGKSSSVTGTRGGSSSAAKTAGRTVGQTVGRSRQKGTSQTDTVSLSRAKMQGISHARGRSRAIGRTHQVAMAQSFQEMEQFSQSYSEALTHTATQTETVVRSTQDGVTLGTSDAAALGQTKTSTMAEKKVYFTLEGERELTINDLQKLPPRHCVVAKTALAAVEIVTYHIPDRYYPYWDRNFPAQILRRQVERYSPVLLREDEQVLAEPKPFLPLNDENSPWEF